MKRKIVIQEKIDSLWDEYNSSVEKVAELSWDENSNKEEMTNLHLKGMFAYKQIEILHWVLKNK